MTLFSPSSSSIITSSPSFHALTFLLGATIGAVLGVTVWQQQASWRNKAHTKGNTVSQKSEKAASDASTATAAVPAIDATAAAAEEHLWKIVECAFTGALIHAGDALGLYDRLWDMGRPVSAAELARATGWSARWLREFLLQATAAGLVQVSTQRPCKDNVDDDVNTASDNDEVAAAGAEEDAMFFSLKAAYADLLRDPDRAPRSIAGMFQLLLPLLNRSKSVVVHSIQTGMGVDYDFEQSHMAELAIDRKNRNWFRDYLVQDIISRVVIPSTGESLSALLEREGGVHAADVGCGCGASTFVLAKRFPKSHFYAYESSTEALNILHKRIYDEQISNVTVCNVAERSLGDGPYPNSENKSDETNTFSFIYCHDVLHDMTDPRSFLREVRRRLVKTGGCCVIVDVSCANTCLENVRNPTAPLFYGWSCLLCLACATCSPTGGEGLGTMGFSAQRCQTWAREAGFTYFEQRCIPSAPHSSCFVIA